MILGERERVCDRYRYRPNHNYDCILSWCAVWVGGIGSFGRSFGRFDGGHSPGGDDGDNLVIVFFLLKSTSSIISSCGRFGDGFNSTGPFPLQMSACPPPFILEFLWRTSASWPFPRMLKAVCEGSVLIWLLSATWREGNTSITSSDILCRRNVFSKSW